MIPGLDPILHRWRLTALLASAGLLATATFAALRDFDLTRGRQFELGTKASFDQQRGELSVAVYDIVRRNLAITDPNDRTRVLPVGEQGSTGVEAAVHWRPSATLSGSVQLAYTEAQFDAFFETVGTTVVSRAGNRPTNVPDVVAGAQLTWQALPALELSADWRHVGKRFANTANTVFDKGYHLLGLGLRWQPRTGVDLRLRLNNAADRSYAATVGTNLVYLGPPRSVSASVDLKF